MAAVWSNGGVYYRAQQLTNNIGNQDLVVKLFVNNHTPAVTDVAGSYTECTLEGYAAAVLTPALWTGIAVGGVATFNYPGITFAITSNLPGDTLYGYFVVNRLDGTQLFAEAFLAPITLPVIGGLIVVTPTYVTHAC